MNKHLNKMFSVTLILALTMSLLSVTRPAQAAPSFFANPTTTIFINEIHYDNAGTDVGESVEVAGPAGTNLTGWSIVLYNGNGGASYATITLAGTIANQQGGYGTLSFPAVGIQNGAPDGIALVNGSTLVQFLSYEGAFTGVGGAANGVLSTNIGVNQAGGESIGSSLQLSGAGDNYGDFTWTSTAAHTFGNPNTGQTFSPADAAPSVSSTFPADGAPNFPFDANLTVTFSEPVNVTSSWFTLMCTISGNVTTSFSGGPATFTLDPSITLVHGENCTLTVLANQVSDQDLNDPPNNMVVNFEVGFTAFNVCASTYTPIYDIQGSGLSTSTPGTVTTQGVVAGDFEGGSEVQGFYLQDEEGDGDSATSDGIFIFTGGTNTVSAGQVVRMTGFARERFNQTTLNGSNSDFSPVTNIVNCGSGTVTATDVMMPFDDADYLERFEGMLVRFPQALVISEYFNYDRFGEIVIALPLAGETRPFTGTAIDEPGAPALARALANSLRRITLDDAVSTQNPNTLRHPNGNPFSLLNRFRGGDTVQNTIGILGFDFNLYRIFPTGPANYAAVNLRPATPEPVGGNLRVAAMNTLNFFLTPDNIQEPSSGPDDPADNLCGPMPSLECRGWDGNQTMEFTRQRDKLLAALAGLDADIIGLNELENTTGVDPLANLVAGLPGYAYVNTGVIGTDAIRVGLIYKTSTVVPVGGFQILDSSDDPRFIDTKSRPVLAQTFEDLSNGARFTVAVNHLKSKGSDCNDVGDPDIGDGQGNCNQTRKLAAQALVDWLATDPTGSGDPDFIIMGDLNSYAQEEPINAIKAGSDDMTGTSDDYTNLIARYAGTHAYSFVFDGQAGYLDHALANPSMSAQVTGATEWHINADEPDILDYDTSFKPPAQAAAIYEPNAYRSSDHDPLTVGLNLALGPQATLAQVIAELQAILAANPGTPLADKIEDVIAKTQSAAAELAKTPPDAQAAIGNIEGAVGDLEAAVKDGLLTEAQGARLMNHLAAAARQLAASATLQAGAQGGDPGKIIEAQNSLAEGDAYRASGRFKDAVSKYKDALSKAEGAQP